MCSASDRLLPILGVLCLALTANAYGNSSLLYFEAQGVAGYSSLEDDVIYYSMNPDAEMQKPGIGFDYLGRFSGNTGDWGAAALQGRLVLTVRDDETELEPQAYNAWFKVKSTVSDFWIGHNRPAFGLGSYYDSHGLLLRTLAVHGFGYDRDWGIGSYRDFSWGSIQLSATTGSGMPILFHGNRMFTGRASYGILNEDNFTMGFSAGAGSTLSTLGYEVMDSEPAEMQMLGADIAFLRNNFEHRAEIISGKWLDENLIAIMYRLSMIIDPEREFRLEAQPTYWDLDKDNWQMGLCLSFRLTSDLTFRIMYEYDEQTNDSRGIIQFYHYQLM